MRRLVIDYFRWWHAALARLALRAGMRVSLLEQMHAMHHGMSKANGHVGYFPGRPCRSLTALHQRGTVDTIEADTFSPAELYLESCEDATQLVESVYPHYKRSHGGLMDIVNTALECNDAEKAFKADLCTMLAAFLSANRLLHKLGQSTQDSILFCGSINPIEYTQMADIVRQSGSMVLDHSRVDFHPASWVAGTLQTVAKSVRRACTILSLALRSTLAKGKPSQHVERSFKLGVSISSPRQLRGKQLGPDFLLDGKTFSQADIAYLPNSALSRKHAERLQSLQGTVVPLPAPREYLQKPTVWLRLFRHWLATPLLCGASALNVATITLLSYFAWRRVTEHTRIENFIASSDFYLYHIGRNIALHQAGVRTWYFTDTINTVCIHSSSVREYTVHPLKTYQHYMHNVTWNSFFAQQHRKAPGNLGEWHVVGCLRASSVVEKASIASEFIPKKLTNMPPDAFLIAAFDTTYTINGLNNYAEGLLFAQHLLMLVERNPRVHLLLKEKKSRQFHASMGIREAVALLRAYEELSQHPRIAVCSNELDAYVPMSIADLVISFSFTSTTFEALSLDRPAIWHDPMELYRDTTYGRIRRATTHGFEELNEYLTQRMASPQGAFQAPFPPGSPLMDPFRDKLAVDRFRQLIAHGH